MILTAHPGRGSPIPTSERCSSPGSCRSSFPNKVTQWNLPCHKPEDSIQKLQDGKHLLSRLLGTVDLQDAMCQFTQTSIVLRDHGFVAEVVALLHTENI